MPFSGDCGSFDSCTLKALSDVGSVYGLFKTDLPFRPNHYTRLFVGETDALNTRLLEHYNHPSIAGVTHFFAEAVATETQRELRRRIQSPNSTHPEMKLVRLRAHIPFKSLRSPRESHVVTWHECHELTKHTSESTPRKNLRRSDSPERTSSKCCVDSLTPSALSGANKIVRVWQDTM